MRKAALPFYALVLLTEIVWMAIVPLAPTFAERLSLSKVETGSVIASAGIATLVVSLPIGLISDRLGARTLVSASSVLVVLSALGQGLAGDFWSLILSRAAFGVALGAIWTAGLAWFSEAGPRRAGPSSLGVPIAVAGLGLMVGPAFAGLLADRFGVRAPFLVLAACTAVVTLAILKSTDRDDVRYGHERLAETLRKARHERIVLGSLLVMVLVGSVNGGLNLLVPLQLRADGLSAGATGLALSASSALFVLFSAAVIRLGARAVTLRIVGIAALLYGGTMLLVVASTSTAALIGFVLVRAPFWAALSTLAYPLGVLGAQRATVGRGAVMGLLNLVWGAAGSLGPVAAGAIAQGAGGRWAFGSLIAGCVAAGGWLLAVGGRPERVGDELSAAPAEAP